jgi:hypothetical protein
MVAPAVPRLVAARLDEPVERAEELSLELETAVPDGTESSVLGMLLLELTGTDPSTGGGGIDPSELSGMSLLMVELLDTGIEEPQPVLSSQDTGISEEESQDSEPQLDTTGISEEESQESQPETVSLDETMILGLE